MLIKPKVSVIVPIFTVEKYIERCARSLFLQTLDEIEFVFVADCSPDNSISILKSIILEYPRRINQIKIIRHEINKGVAASRVTGVEACSGDFIIHCDSDDDIDIRMYELMYEKAINEDADVVSCDFYWSTIDCNTPFSTPQWSSNQQKNLRTYIASVWTTLWQLIIKRDVYNSNSSLNL